MAPLRTSFATVTKRASRRCAGIVVGIVLLTCMIALVASRNRKPPTDTLSHTKSRNSSISSGDGKGNVSNYHLEDDLNHNVVELVKSLRALSNHLVERPKAPATHLHQQQQRHVDSNGSPQPHLHPSDDSTAGNVSSMSVSTGKETVGGRDTAPHGVSKFWGNSNKNAKRSRSNDQQQSRQSPNMRMEEGTSHVTSENHTRATIFVSLASFRDAECEPTVIDLFRTASFPTRIFVGIVEQHDDAHHHHHRPLKQGAGKDAPCVGSLLQASSCFLVTTQGGKSSCTMSTVVVDASDDGPKCLDVNPNGGGGGTSGQQHWTSFCPADNIRIRRTTPMEAKGPTFGRFVAASMYHGESYFLMMDSHNRFIPGWDVTIVREHMHVVQSRRDRLQSESLMLSSSSTTAAPVSPPPPPPGANRTTTVAVPRVVDPEKVVLSHYPAPYSTRRRIRADGKERYQRFMCSGHFIESGVFRLDSEAIAAPQHPIWQPFTAAGFLFSTGSMLLDVPFDPHLDYLFDGEEILYSARLFTHGWDSYLPSVNIMYHFYGRPNSPKVWSVPNNLWWVHQKVSNVRVLALMGQDGDVRKMLEKPEHHAAVNHPRVLREIDKFGMGSARTIGDFWDVAGVDRHTKAHTAGGPASYCMALSNMQTRGSA